jgi:hypothetical protein
MTLLTFGLWFPVWFFAALWDATVKEKVVTYHED